MSHYIKTVIGAVLAISMLNCFFTKDGFGKYVNLLSAVIVMAVILSPILNISKNISINTKNIDVKPLEIKGNTYIMEEFEERLSIEIADELKKKTNIDSYTPTTNTGIIRTRADLYSSQQVLSTDEERKEYIDRGLKR